jgi:hypothetical protein
MVQQYVCSSNANIMKSFRAVHQSCHEDVYKLHDYCVALMNLKSVKNEDINTLMYVSCIGLYHGIQSPIITSLCIVIL